MYNCIISIRQGTTRFALLWLRFVVGVAFVCVLVIKVLHQIQTPKAEQPTDSSRPNTEAIQQRTPATEIAVQRYCYIWAYFWNV
jgi:hypothetical protein